MEFWGVEVKAGQKLKVHPGSDKVLHLSQAALGVTKKGKGNESVPLFLKVDDQKLVIGTLNADNCRQITYDLVFQKEFELSHSWAYGSVFFCGYKAEHGDDDDSSDDEFSSEEEEDITLVTPENDVPSKPSTDNANSKAKVVEPIKEVKEMEVDSDSDDEEDDSEDDSKSKVKVVEPIKDEKVKEEDTDSDDEEDDSEDDSAEEMDDSSDDEDDDSSDDEDEDGSSDEEDEATPKKNKKRNAPSAESDPKTPTGKKAKLVTPQKIDGEGKKTGGHIATPYPSKQAGKTSANKDKSKQQTPQTPGSDGQVSCGSCSRSFKSDQARDAHSKAKHGPAK